MSAPTDQIAHLLDPAFVREHGTNPTLGDGSPDQDPDRPDRDAVTITFQTSFETWVRVTYRRSLEEWRVSGTVEIDGDRFWSGLTADEIGPAFRAVENLVFTTKQKTKDARTQANVEAVAGIAALAADPLAK